MSDSKQEGRPDTDDTSEEAPTGSTSIGPGPDDTIDLAPDPTIGSSED